LPAEFFSIWEIGAVECVMVWYYSSVFEMFLLLFGVLHWQILIDESSAIC